MATFKAIDFTKGKLPHWNHTFKLSFFILKLKKMLFEHLEPRILLSNWHHIFPNLNFSCRITSYHVPTAARALPPHWKRVKICILIRPIVRANISLPAIGRCIFWQQLRVCIYSQFGSRFTCELSHISTHSSAARLERYWLRAGPRKQFQSTHAEQKRAPRKSARECSGGGTRLI